MARPTKSTLVERTTAISATGINTTQPPAVIHQEGFPQGDNGIAQLSLNYDGIITVTGGSGPSKVADGEKKFLRSLTIETDKHGKIVDGVDGLTLNRVLTYEWAKAPKSTGVSATPADADTFHHGLNIPLVLPHGYKPFDTMLDVIRARPKVTTQYGLRSDIFGYTGGSPLVHTVTDSIECKYLPGPLKHELGPDGEPTLESETPRLVRNWEQLVYPISQTQNRFQIPLPYNDRIYRRIFITQRNGSDRSELSTVVTATGEISLVYGGVEIFQRTRFRDIQTRNEAEYRVDSPTGVCVLDFDSDQQERINDLLGGVTKDSGNAYLYIDVNSVSNGQLWIVIDSLKAIRPEAKR